MSDAGVLHLLLSEDECAWRACRACCAGEDTVVLLDDAVMKLADRPQDPFPCRLAVSGPDARARGLPSSLEGDMEVLSDKQLVGLIESHRHCLSWR